MASSRDAARPVYYGDYLQLDRLLDCQKRLSEAAGRPAHDEFLFIIIHQAYELWFRQILFEMDRVQGIFARPAVDDRDISVAVSGLGRIHEILKLLVHQVDILETMTPLDFLDFRDFLYPASGFQSAQFRRIETRLGLRRADRLPFDHASYDARLEGADREAALAAEAAPSLSDQVEAWLARTPFVDFGGYHFREAYREAVSRALRADLALVQAQEGRGSTRAADIDRLSQAMSQFEALFDTEAHGRQHAAGHWRFGQKALQAALFIALYRDEPMLQLPFRLLGLLMDIDETMTTWRYRHALMVQRMIGMKVGTGGSSGHDYLRATAEQHRVFRDLFALSTFLVPRSALPPLPEPLRRAMSFNWSGA